MQNTMKTVIAVVLAALIVVIGLIVLTNTRGQAPEAPVATEAPAATQAPEATEAPQDSEEAPATPEDESPEEADASTEDLYEGALAGLTEEEIGELAMAEEGAQVEGAGEDGVD